MSFIASIILRDRIAMVSDSRVVSEPVSRAGTGKEADKGTGKEAAKKANIITVEDDHARKLFKLTDTIGLSYVGVHQYPPLGLTLEAALEGFQRNPGNLGLPPVAMADALRDHLAAYWNGTDQPQFCFHLAGYYRGRPFLLVRFNPLPPAGLVNHLHAPIPPWVLHINGADDDSVFKALEGIKAPLFERIPPAQAVNFMVDMTFRVIDRVPCCGGDVQAQIIAPGGIADFRAVRDLPKIVHGQYAPGKYGLEVTQGEVYSTTFQTGDKDSKTYVAMVPPNYLQVWSDVGGVSKKQLEIAAHPGGGGGGVDFYRDDNFAGTIQVDSSGFFMSAIGSNLKLSAANVIVTDNLIPDTHLTGEIGTTFAVWDYVRASHVLSGDLCFREETCAVCGEAFVPGETVTLLVKAVQPGHMTATIPIHDRCKDTPKTLAFEVQETETRYRLDDNGEIIAYSSPVYIEETMEMVRLREGYSLDEATGQFRKNAFVVDVAREGYSARLKSIYDDAWRLLPPAKRGVVFYDELTGQEVDLSSILEPVEVFPERPAEKEEAVEVVTVKRRRPVMKSITIEIGKAGS